MSEDANELDRKLAYYRKRLDEVAGKLVQSDYRISQLKHALEQRRRGFALLAEFQQAIGGLTTRSEVVRVVAGALIGSLGMNRVVVYERNTQGFAQSMAIGFDEQAPPGALPPDVTAVDRALLVTRKTPPDAPEHALLGILGVSSCASVPLRDDGAAFAILVAGRVKELPPLYPALDEVDVETLVVIAASIHAALQTRRIAVLRELDHLKTDFFANISHEFRTPITLTLAPIESLLSGRAGSLSDDAKEHLTVMQRSQRKLLDLVNQILDLATIEAGKATLRRVAHGDVPALLGTIARGFDELARTRGLRIVVDGSPQPVDTVVPIDVEKFERAVLNLVANAIKFTSEGSVALRWCFTPTALQVLVQDTGIGIEASEVPLMFDRFRRSSSTARHAGTGIGLTLVKEIVELHEGTVQVESQRHVGTTFTLSFPTRARTITDALRPSIAPRMMATPTAEPSDDRGADEVHAWNRDAARTASVHRATVLYVDDNHDLRRHVRALLADEFNTFVACDGAEALAALAVRPFDLVLSDVTMPHVDGVEFARRVRADPALCHMPVVLLTARAGEADRLAALNIGVDDYLAKPFSQAELLARVRNILRARAQQLRTERDIVVARSIQQAVLPPSTSRFATGATIEHLYEPCEALSGDFCDVQSFANGVITYVADVTNHGIAAAQVTYLVREAFRRHCHETASLDELLAMVAAEYQRYALDFDVSVHAAFLRHRKLFLCRAGAPLAIRVRHRSAEVIAAPPSVSLSWIGDRSELPVVALDVEAGDQFFLFTDGALELSVAGRPLGLRRLRELLSAASCAPDWRVPLRDLFSEARRRGDLQDDATIVRLDVSVPECETSTFMI
jgi:signal transduction histidine kinase/DNA-binding response OmpR family regulator